MALTVEHRQKLIEGLKAFAEFRKQTGINALDNYGYREALQILELRALLPSIDKVPGRTGADAKAEDQGYTNIELKSNHFEKNKLTISNWPCAMFDMSKKGGKEKLYKFEGFGHGLFNSIELTLVASYFIKKEHMYKMHPLFDQKIAQYELFKESKETLREAIEISLQEVIKHVDPNDIVFFKNGEIVTIKEEGGI